MRGRVFSSCGAYIVCVYVCVCLLGRRWGGESLELPRESVSVFQEWCVNYWKDPQGFSGCLISISLPYSCESSEPWSHFEGETGCVQTALQHQPDREHNSGVSGSSSSLSQPWPLKWAVLLRIDLNLQMLDGSGRWWYLYHSLTFTHDYVKLKHGICSNDPPNT